MRVLLAVEQLRRSLPGGIGRYARGLLAGLSDLQAEERSGAEIELLASRPSRAAAVAGLEGHPGDPLAAWGFPVRSSALPGPALTRAWDLGMAAAPPAFDVVHSVSLAAPPVRRGRAPGGGRPSLVISVHDLAWRAHPDSTTARGRRWHEGALRRALRRADAFLTPAEGVAAQLRSLGAGADAVVVVPFGADHLPPPDEPGADALLGRLGVRGQYLLSAGTLEPRKNLRRLAGAYAEAERSLPEPWPLVVVGPRGWGDAGLGGKPSTSAAPSPAPHGAGRGVVAAGPVSDGVLAALYRRARAFVYVPLTEGFGFPPLEAMGAGVPVVASTGVPSVAPQPGEMPAALRVDPESVEAIAEALVAAATDEPLRHDLVARGTSHYQSLTWRRC
ncbi:MAG TPA: glycosyltransferase family 1 protein, partial [Acidimicrobiales bacterium]|nr:glycosyltransferase family 1 protein [Acidimicrobiales bacterium]